MLMLSPNPRVAIVDNRQDQLDDLVKHFGGMKVPCAPFLYSDSTPPFEEEERRSIRVVFMDMDLTARGGFSPRTDTGFIASALRQVAPLDAPYAIIFWSSHATEDNVKETLKLLKDEDGTPTPISYAILDKDELRGGNIQALHDSLSGHPEIDAAQLWEQQIASSAAALIKDLNDLTYQCNPSDFDAKCQLLAKIFGKIMGAALGDRADEEKGLAFHKGLLPLLKDKLESQTSVENLNEILGRMVDHYEVKTPLKGVRLNDKIRTQLIAMTDYSPVASPLDRYEPGTWVELGARDLARLGQNAAAFRRGPRRVSAFVTLLDRKELERGDYPADVLSRHKSNLQSGLREIKANSILGVLEVTPVCDYSNNKAGRPRFLLSLLVPKNLFFKKYGKSKLCSPCSASIAELPIVQHAGSAWIPLVDFNHLYTLPVRKALVGPPLFRLRRSLLMSLMQQFNHHAARPGRINFTS